LITHRADRIGKETIGVILLNLGGPDSLNAIKPFLYNLFSDRQIIQLGPPFLQKQLAWLISTIRSKKTEKMYAMIGGKSPILDITIAQAKALEEALNQESGVGSQKSERNKDSKLRTTSSELSFKVYVGMRYWHPLIEEVIPKIYNDGIRKLIALSLYPHYSLATSGSSLTKLKEVLIKIYKPEGAKLTEFVSSFEHQKGKSSFAVHNSQFTVHCITSWFNHPLYIEALVDVIKRGLESFIPPHTLPPHILFSAHSLPKKIIDEGDPYVNQITGTIEEITRLMPIKWHLSYQSKSGPVKWLEPSTDEKLKELAREGVKDILVVPISFVSDHIETLYEIDILYKNIADKLGIKLKRVDSLNTHPHFIEALKDMVEKSAKEMGLA
jgi:ferrochelatase